MKFWDFSVALPRGGRGGKERWTARTVKRPPQQPAQPQYANYWAPLTRKRHIPPHSAQPRHTNHWAPRTWKRHQQEHRLQRPTESSDPTQHAEGRTGDCPGPRKETTTRRNVTQGGKRGTQSPRSCCLILGRWLPVRPSLLSPDKPCSYSPTPCTRCPHSSAEASLSVPRGLRSGHNIVQGGGQAHRTLGLGDMACEESLNDEMTNCQLDDHSNI